MKFAMFHYLISSKNVKLYNKSIKIGKCALKLIGKL